MKGRAVAALTAALALLVVVIFLARAGKAPIVLGLLVAVFTVYGLRMLWRLKKAGVPPTQL